MVDPVKQGQLKEAIADRIGTDQGVLDALRDEIRPLKDPTEDRRGRFSRNVSVEYTLAIRR
jgi:hypothetical protein